MEEIHPFCIGDSVKLKSERKTMIVVHVNPFSSKMVVVSWLDVHHHLNTASVDYRALEEVT